MLNYRFLPTVIDFTSFFEEMVSWLLFNLGLAKQCDVAMPWFTHFKFRDYNYSNL